MNTLKTVFLMAALSVLFVLLGNWIGGETGMIIAFIFAVVMNFGSYWFSDKIVLRMYRAREVDEREAPGLVKMVRALSERAELPMPKVYVMDSPLPNAFATGRNPKHSAVAVTTGLVEMLDRDELAGVIGHELAHIKNRDILTGTIAATFAGAITYLANMLGWMFMFGGSDEDDGGGLGALVMMIVAPIAAMMLQMAISRSREYVADKDGSEIAGNPRALASALEKLQMANGRVRQSAEPSTAHMFIVSPLNGGGVMKLFSTHPPIEERIKKLLQMR